MPNDDKRVEFPDKSVVSIHTREEVVLVTVYTKAPPKEQIKDGFCFLSIAMNKEQWDSLHGK